MKKIVLSLSVICLSSILFGQNNILAITSSNTTKIQAESIQYLDNNIASNNLMTNLKSLPTEQIAALAMDQSMENLIFMDMNTTSVHIYNLDSKTTTTLPHHGKINNQCSIGAQFSRMALSPNGNIYAVNNNATSVLEISKKGSQFYVKDLGEIKDLSVNQRLLQSQEGWGGDLIADSNGMLYLISAFGNIFTLDLDKMTTDFYGKIKNLPKGFTTNGAAVNADGSILLANAQGKGTINTNLTELTFDKVSPSTYSIYDLASPYFLKVENEEAVLNNDFIINPTRLKNRYLSIENRANLSGEGLIEVFDINGKSVYSKTISLNQDKVDVVLDNIKQIGYYFVKIYDSNKAQIHSERIVIVK